MMEYVDFVEPDFSDDVAELETGKQSAAAPAEAQKIAEEKENTRHENSGNENSSYENAEQGTEQEAEQPENSASKARMERELIIYKACFEYPGQERQPVRAEHGGPAQIYPGAEGNRRQRIL